MTTEEIRDKFISLLKDNFPELKYKVSKLKSGNTRISPYLPNSKRCKRWMQLDSNPEYFSIAMDHKVREISLEDLHKTNIPYGLNGERTGIIMKENYDAVNISIFIHDLYDIHDKAFLDFLNRHYKSYINLINS